MPDCAEARELCTTISLNMERLSGIAEQLYNHAGGEMETDVAARRADSMAIIRDMTRALVDLIDLAQMTPLATGKTH